MAGDDMDAARAAALRAAVRQKYVTVAREPRGQFPYPVGRESLLELRYRAEWIDAVPALLADRFVGVGNPMSLRVARPGERVLDVGCGSAVDTVIASRLVGAEGAAVGIDLTAEMLGWPVGQLRGATVGPLAFAQASVEELPFDDATFDLVISNGALNLVPDKDRAFRELARVLAPHGELVVADLVVRGAIPEHVLASEDAWST